MPTAVQVYGEALHVIQYVVAASYKSMSRLLKVAGSFAGDLVERLTRNLCAWPGLYTNALHRCATPETTMSEERPKVQPPGISVEVAVRGPLTCDCCSTLGPRAALNWDSKRRLIYSLSRSGQVSGCDPSFQRQGKPHGIEQCSIVRYGIIHSTVKIHHNIIS